MTETTIRILRESISLLELKLTNDNNNNIEVKRIKDRLLLLKARLLHLELGKQEIV